MLSEYDVKIVYKSGKLHVVPDALFRYPVECKEGEEVSEIPFLMLSSDTIPVERLKLEQGQVPQWAKAMQELKHRPNHAWKNFCVENGFLYKRNVSADKCFIRLCVPPNFRQELLMSCHDDVLVDHLGIRRTLR
jgi:hypothetical protein